MDDVCSAVVVGDLWGEYVEVNYRCVFEGIRVYPSLAEVALEVQ